MSAAPHFLSVLGPIIAACIAAVVSFLALVISKENKTSEFRQAWIDGLRQDLSQFAANLRRLEAQPTYVDWKALTSSTMKETLDAANERALRPDFFAENRLRLLQSRYAIRLRLNPGEANGMALLAQVDKALEAYYSSADVEAELESLMNLAQPFLKQEWVRVKKGEPVFRASVVVAKWLAAVLAALVLVGAYLVWKAASAT
ncbi:MAG: hypothetical protein R3E55_08775 [Burkholderiaceae bacterium]|jgi:hypothetical protein|nr:hypothetical protein [Burkholderiaceae bacterium]